MLLLVRTELMALQDASKLPGLPTGIHTAGIMLKHLASRIAEARHINKLPISPAAMDTRKLK